MAFRKRLPISEFLCLVAVVAVLFVLNWVWPWGAKLVVLLLLATSGVGAIVGTWLSIRRRRWWRDGCCIQCGYDLRVTSSDRCPECGAEMVTSRRYDHEIMD